jgi:hypothetical protein
MLETTTAGQDITNTLSFMSMGTTNARVFPEPVGAQAKHSRSYPIP